MEVITITHAIGSASSKSNKTSITQSSSTANEALLLNSTESNKRSELND